MVKKNKSYWQEQRQLAENLAKFFHRNQVDKAGQPYINHIKVVSSQVDYDDKLYVVACLHDIVEDTCVRFKDLVDFGIDEEVIDIIKVLTHRPNVSYEEYIINISKNKDAIKVKLADLKHNSDIGRLNKITEDDLKRLDKYKRCIKFLEDLS